MLKDKVIKWYPVNSDRITAKHKPHYYESDVKEAVLKKQSNLEYRKDVLINNYNKSDVFTIEQVIEIFEREIEENIDIFGDFEK